MDSATKERISRGVRANWAARKSAAASLAEQAAAMEGANRRLLAALYTCSAALAPYAEGDRLAAHALRELEAAETEIKVSNLEARETLALYGVDDPTRPAARTPAGTNGGADGRHAPLSD